jgi:hypothetical protein
MECVKALTFQFFSSKIAYDTYAKTEPSKLYTNELTAIPSWNRTRTEGNG